MNIRRWTEKGKTKSKANTERVHKNDGLEEDTRRTIIVDSRKESLLLQGMQWLQ